METKIAPIIDREKIGKPIFFVLAKYNRNPSVTNRHFPARQNIPSLDIISWIDPKTKARSTRTIQYMPSEQSIFLDEQTEQSQKILDKSTIRMRGQIWFGEEGVIAVDPRETLKIQYLRLCNWNGDNTDRMPDKEIIFKEHKAGVQATANMDKEFEMAETIMLVRNMNLPTLKSYAKTLRINIDREVSEIRHDMLIAAKKDPKGFAQGLQNPAMARMYYILEAIDTQVLVKNSVTNTLSWKNGNVIIQGRPNQSVEEELANWTLSSEDGQTVFSHIKQSVSESEAKLSQDVKEKTETGAIIMQNNLPPLIVDEDVAYIKSLYEKKIIWRAKAWVKWDGGQLIGKDDKLIAHLKVTPELKAKFDELLKK